MRLLRRTPLVVSGTRTGVSLQSSFRTRWYGERGFPTLPLFRRACVRACVRLSAAFNTRRSQDDVGGKASVREGDDSGRLAGGQAAAALALSPFCWHCSERFRWL